MLFAILILRAGLPLSSPAENTHSMPFGFVRIEIPTNDTHVLVSIPFYSLDPAIQTMFSGQLISTNAESAHRIVKWDVENQSFVYATRLSSTNDASDGQWGAGGASSRETASPSDMTIYPGEGFFIELAQGESAVCYTSSPPEMHPQSSPPGRGQGWVELDAPQAIFLWGQLVLDPSIALHLKPGLNLIGFPYSSAKPISDTGLPIAGPEADVITKYNAGQYWQVVNVSTNPQQPVVFRWQSVRSGIGDNSGKPVWSGIRENSDMEGGTVWSGIGDNSGNTVWSGIRDNSGIEGGYESAVFEIGSGYWYQRNATNELIWSEERPYADLFPTSGPPFVIAMRPNNAGDEMTLTIACSGSPGELLDIFYKDAGPTNELSVLGGWLPAARNIPVPTTTNPEYSIITWTDSGSARSKVPSSEESTTQFPSSEGSGVGDSGSAARPKVNDVFVRHYLLVRGDLDRDGDEVSDGEELLMRGTNPQVSDSFTESQSSGWSGIRENSGLSSNETASVAQSASRQNIIHIDQKTGDDRYSGHSASVAGTDGPKKTIAAGLAIAKHGDTVLIKEGIYGESMDLLGKGVTVIIQGKVDLTRRGK